MKTVADVEQWAGRIRAAFQPAAGQWTGCDWPTTFWTTRLNLDGLRASQAFLLARATTGAEAADWRAAVTWLTQIEKHASRVEALAQRAERLSQASQMREALEIARQACRFESSYHRAPIWQAFCEAIEEALKAKGDREEQEKQAFVGSCDTKTSPSSNT